MPKMKTSRAAAKRFKLTGTGELKRSKPYKRHILTKQSVMRSLASSYAVRNERGGGGGGGGGGRGGGGGGGGGGGKNFF